MLQARSMKDDMCAANSASFTVTLTRIHGYIVKFLSGPVFTSADSPWDEGCSERMSNAPWKPAPGETNVTDKVNSDASDRARVWPETWYDKTWSATQAVRAIEQLQAVYTTAFNVLLTIYSTLQVRTQWYRSNTSVGQRVCSSLTRVGGLYLLLCWFSIPIIGRTRRINPSPCAECDARQPRQPHHRREFCAHRRLQG